MREMSRVLVEAPAKINLFLDITSVAENGYHLLDTVMQAILLTDFLYISRVPGEEIRVTCSQRNIPEGPTNLAWKAAALYFEKLSILRTGLHIHIDKRIPSQAGLGGGSSDAAAVLVGLERLFQRGVGLDTLCDWGLLLGADVPFALRGGCGRARGIGEKIAPLPLLPSDCFILVAKPDSGMDTRDAYSRYDRLSDPLHQDISPILDALQKGSSSACGAAMFNIFEQACPSEDTSEFKKQMLDCGAMGAALSGSGSAVAGIFRSEAAARNCADLLSKTVPQVFLVKPAAEGPRVLWEG